MRKDSVRPFFELIRAGLWGSGNPDIRIDGATDWNYIYRLAQEQSVQGLVLQGVECLKNHNVSLCIPQVLLLQWIGEVQVIQQRNKAMNAFVAELVEKMRAADIYAILVKGQGVAQCYEKPLWRACGDIDLYMSNENFQKSRQFFRPLVESDEIDDDYAKSINMHYGEWVIEIHRSQYVNLSFKIDRVLDTIHDDLFYCGNVRSCNICGTQVFLPSADNDIITVFTHFLKHFYKGGLGLRQICDWCRLLWTYKDTLNQGLLEKRIREMDLMSEWRAFGVFTVKYLGMPIEAMPLLDDNHNANLNRKADRICEFILEVGNFGHNRDNSYFQKHSFFVQKSISAWRRVKDLCRHATIFPFSSVRFFFGIMHNGIVSAVRGE